MRALIFSLFAFFFVIHFVSAIEVPKTREQILEEKIQNHVDTGLGTIKVFISERGECKNIVHNTTIRAWYMSFIDELAKPIEERKRIYESQSTPLKEEILLLKEEIEEKNTLIAQKKKDFIDNYVIQFENEKLLAEIKSLGEELLKTTNSMNLKNQELKNITTEFDKYPKIPRKDIIQSYESKILQHCKTWYGKIELTDKRTLDQVISNTTTNIITPQSKYKKQLDTITLEYLKNPEKVKSLRKRLATSLRKLSKDHKNYALLQAMKKHIDTLK